MSEKDPNIFSYLSKKENNFRKYFKCYLFIELIFFCISLIIGYWNNTLAQLWYLSCSVLKYYMLYYCAYKKHGTAWLAYCMAVVYPLYIIKTLWGAVSNSGNLEFFIGLLISIFLSGIFYYFALKMRDINRKIQSFKFLSSDYYQNAINSLRSAQNLDDLARKFHDVFQECPSHFSGALSLIYEEIKQQLSLPQKVANEFIATEDFPMGA